MPKFSDLIRLAIAAGVAIGLAGFVYLSLIYFAHGVAGAVLFSFGLLTVVNYKLKLYTSTAGFIHRHEWPHLLVILFFNVLGCWLVSLLLRCSGHGALQLVAEQAVLHKLEDGWLNSGVLSIGCGIIMTVAATFAYKGNFLPLLLGVPVFIKCGFPHCIADSFYITSCSIDFLQTHAGELLAYFPAIVVGNFIGCNLPRLFPKYWESPAQ